MQRGFSPRKKRPLRMKRAFYELQIPDYKTRKSLLTARGRRCGGTRSARRVALNPRPVVFHKLLLAAVAIRGVEVIVQHLGINLVERPMVVVEAVNRAHDSRPVTTAGAVYEKLAGRGIVNEFQKLLNLRGTWILLIGNRNVHITHALCFNVAFFLRGIVCQINHSPNAQGFQVREITFAWPRAAIEAFVHLAKVLNFDI